MTAIAKMKRKSSSGESRSESKKRRGPRLPSRLLKEIDELNPTNLTATSDTDENDRLALGDVYEYEEVVAEEEAAKNRRFDPVENLEYELPENFQDEDVSSEDDIENDGAGNEGEDNDDDIDEDRHARMLSSVTGMPSETFQGKKKKKNNNKVVVTEVYPGSEYNHTLDVLECRGLVSINDSSKLKRRMNEFDKKAPTLQAPLHKAEKDRLERKVAYEHLKEDLNKWEPLVQRNRRAPTIFFNNKVDVGYSTIGAIAAAFEPRTEFEKKMAELTSDDVIMDAHRNDGLKLIENVEASAKDEKDYRDRMAKLRSLLFTHELKARRIKRIKSKKFHRLLKKDRLKAASSEDQLDSEAAKDLAKKHEYKRAKERMTLRHKGSSKWAKRIKERGLNAQDEGTRAAIAEQQNIYSDLVRKMRSVRDSSSDSEDSDDGNESEDNSSCSEQGRASKLRLEAQEKIQKVLNEDDDEVPKSGLLSLPFMVRGMQKQREALADEAKLDLEEVEGSNGADTSRGRMVFNAAGKQALNKTVSAKKTKKDRFYDESDSEYDLDAENNDHDDNDGSNDLQKDAGIDSSALRDVSEVHHEGLFKSFEDIVKDPSPKTTYEVGILKSSAWKKVKGESSRVAGNKTPPIISKKLLKNKAIKETAKDLTNDSESDSEIKMVDDILSSHQKESYGLPSQAELIHQAFAGDDVEGEFEKQKENVLNEENPEPEKPIVLPGWGQWTEIQEKKGMPSWMVKEHEIATKKRQEAINKRKDASLKRVFISEKLDKRVEKLSTKKLPFPYKSKEVFEQSMRMPLGPQFHPATTFAALNRPDVVRKAGHIIRPIKFEEVDPYHNQRHDGHVQKQRKKQNPNQKKKVRVSVIIVSSGELIVLFS